MKKWIRVLAAFGGGLIITACGCVGVMFGPRALAGILAPGALVTRAMFSGVHSESHMIGWPSSAEIVSLVVLNTIFYGAAVLGLSMIRRGNKG